MANMKRVILSLDIGGTFIKSGLLTEAGLAAEIPAVAIDSGGKAAGILESFASAIRNGNAEVVRRFPGKTRADAVGVCMPDPFDYRRGISRMEHKFASIYGQNLPMALLPLVPELNGVSIAFSHDACAFLAGERWKGNVKGYDRVIGITLGTGLGAAIAVDGQLLLSELGSPAVSVWNSPYKGGIAEDSISTRALLIKYQAAFPDYDATKGVKGIADAARQKEPHAVRAFEEMGTDLGRVLMPLHEQFGIQAIVFGGQIAKSFDLFEPALTKEFRRSVHPPVLKVTALSNAAALYGAAAELFTK